MSVLSKGFLIHRITGKRICLFQNDSIPPLIRSFYKFWKPDSNAFAPTHITYKNNKINYEYFGKNSSNTISNDGIISISYDKNQSINFIRCLINDKTVNKYFYTTGALRQVDEHIKLVGFLSLKEFNKDGSLRRYKNYNCTDNISQKIFNGLSICSERFFKKKYKVVKNWYKYYESHTLHYYEFYDFNHVLIKSFYKIYKEYQDTPVVFFTLEAYQNYLMLS